MSLLAVFDVESQFQSVEAALSAIKQFPDEVNDQNDAGWTPLRIVTSVWSLDAALVLVPALLQAGASPDIPARKGLLTPVHAAAKEGKIQILRHFLERDGGAASAEVATSEGLRALHYACEIQRMDMVTLLVDRGVDIHALTADGNSCLHYCGAVKWREGFDFLLGLGVNGHQRNERDWTAWGKLFSDEIQAAAMTLRQQRRSIRNRIDAVRLLRLAPHGSEQAFLDGAGDGAQARIVFDEAYRTFQPRSLQGDPRRDAQP